MGWSNTVKLCRFSHPNWKVPWNPRKSFILNSFWNLKLHIFGSYEKPANIILTSSYIRLKLVSFDPCLSIVFLDGGKVKSHQFVAFACSNWFTFFPKWFLNSFAYTASPFDGLLCLSAMIDCSKSDSTFLNPSLSFVNLLSEQVILYRVKLNSIHIQMGPRQNGPLLMVSREIFLD